MGHERYGVGTGRGTAACRPALCRNPIGSCPQGRVGRAGRPPNSDGTADQHGGPCPAVHACGRRPACSMAPGFRRASSATLQSSIAASHHQDRAAAQGCQSVRAIPDDRWPTRGHRRGSGLARPIRQGTAGQATTTPATRAGKGRAVQEQIVGADRVERMCAAAAGDEPHVQQLLSANCLGAYYTRTGIDVPTRELLAFAILSALGGCEPPVRTRTSARTMT